MRAPRYLSMLQHIKAQYYIHTENEKKSINHFPATAVCPKGKRTPRQNQKERRKKSISARNSFLDTVVPYNFSVSYLSSYTVGGAEEERGSREEYSIILLSMAALNYIYTVYSTRSTLTDIGQHRAGGGFSDIFPPFNYRRNSIFLRYQH